MGKLLNQEDLATFQDTLQREVKSKGIPAQNVEFGTWTDCHGTTLNAFAWLKLYPDFPASDSVPLTMFPLTFVVEWKAAKKGVDMPVGEDAEPKHDDAQGEKEEDGEDDAVSEDAEDA